jgi:hypothetical protein
VRLNPKAETFDSEYPFDLDLGSRGPFSKPSFVKTIGHHGLFDRPRLTFVATAQLLAGYGDLVSPRLACMLLSSRQLMVPNSWT